MATDRTRSRLGLVLHGSCQRVRRQSYFEGGTAFTIREPQDKPSIRACLAPLFQNFGSTREHQTPAPRLTHHSCNRFRHQLLFPFFPPILPLPIPPSMASRPAFGPLWSNSFH